MCFFYVFASNDNATLDKQEDISRYKKKVTVSRAGVVFVFSHRAVVVFEFSFFTQICNLLNTMKFTTINSCIHIVSKSAKLSSA